MKKYHANRLRKLADHLKKGKLGHKRFDFATWNQKKNGEFVNAPICGYAGCAIGECPIVFPRQWKFSDLGVPTNSDFNTAELSAEDFFSLNRDEFYHLFVPHSQDANSFGGKHLTRSATRYEVASNIYAFLKVKGF